VVSEYAAFRAAGQVIAALMHGAPIESAGHDGIVMTWSALAASERPRSKVLADIAIGLAGIAAEARYGFGSISSSSCVVSWRFDSGQIADFGTVNALVDDVDPSGDEDVLFLAWCQALDLVADAAVWRAIRTIAGILDCRDMTGTETAQIAAHALDAVPIELKKPVRRQSGA
jgi:hypothetical protein